MKQLARTLENRWPISLALLLAVAGLLGVLAACTGQSAKTPPAAPAASPTATPSSQQVTPTATPVPLKVLKLNPEKGPAGTAFTVSGQDLPPGKAVQLQWVTWNGAYETKASAENVEFYEPKFVEQRVILGSATADAQGQVTATFTAPEDFGDVHDIYAIAEGQEVAKGGFRVLTTATLAPTEGAVGTPITLTVKGMGWKPFERTLGLRYDNAYMGFISAVTTKGTATFQIRAAGPVGAHTIQLIQSSTGQPYLNVQQSPVAFRWTHVPSKDFSWVFTVKEDKGPPPSTLEWPDAGLVAAVSDATPRTTAGSQAAPGVSAALAPAVGAILSQTTLKAGGLSANAEVDIIWVSARGNRLSPSGWNLIETPLGNSKASPDGSLQAALQVPDDLGGWHVIKLVQGEKTLVEVPYYVVRSLATVNPTRVKAGETFTVQVKGVGWTELDNGFAVAYDNGYIGYACGFNSNGDVTMTLVATGGSGTHLIDIYPYIFQGHGKPPWSYQIPQLTALQDHPGLALGYRLPIFRLAVEVVE